MEDSRDRASGRIQRALDALGLQGEALPRAVIERLRVRAAVPGARLEVGPFLVVDEVARGEDSLLLQAWSSLEERMVSLRGGPWWASQAAAERFRDEYLEAWRDFAAAGLEPSVRASLPSIEGAEIVAEAPSRFRVFFVLTHFAGVALAERLAIQGPLPEATALSLFASLTRVLATAHDRGLHHGALDPSVVFLAVPDRCVLLDLGMPRAGPTSAEADRRALGRLFKTVLAGPGADRVAGAPALVRAIRALDGDVPVSLHDVGAVLSALQGARDDARPSGPRMAPVSPVGATPGWDIRSEEQTISDGSGDHDAAGDTLSDGGDTLVNLRSVPRLDPSLGDGGTTEIALAARQPARSAAVARQTIGQPPKVVTQPGLRRPSLPPDPMTHARRLWFLVAAGLGAMAAGLWVARFAGG